MRTIRITIKDTSELNLSWKLAGLWEIWGSMICRIEEPHVEYKAKNLTRYELPVGVIDKLTK